MDQRSNFNVIEFIDWTTGLLVSDGTNPSDAIQAQQVYLGSTPPVVQLSATPTRYAPPSYSFPAARVTEVSCNSGGGGASSSNGNGNSYRRQSEWYPLASSCRETLASSSSLSSAGYCNPHYPPGGHQSGVPVAASPVVSCSGSSTLYLPLPTRAEVSSRQPSESIRSDAMASRARSNNKGKERISQKRGTSVMSEPSEERGGRSCKFQRSHSSSLVDYDDVQSNLTRDVASHDEDEEDGPEDSRRMMTPSPTPSEERRSVRGGGGRQNHSEIEKRRRDKMNTYITELSRVVPMCITMSHKLDKLTVLRMAVQHLKTIRGVIHSYTEGDYKPAFLSDEELKHLILQSADGFVFVADSNRGRMLYVSESVSQVLNYSQGDLLGQSWFDILHPKDVAKVKEQLSSLTAANSNDIPHQGLSRLCPGARRSFFCRMKFRAGPSATKEQSDGASSKQRKAQSLSKEKKYVVIHCTGYLKSWAPAKVGVEDHDSEGDVDACNLSCLVAVGRLQPSLLSNAGCRSSDSGSNQSANSTFPHVEFTSRHTIDGKFLFVDQRSTLLLGLLPQELLGTSMYEYYHVDDIVSLAESHKAALQNSETVTTAVYRFRVKEGTYVKLQSRWKSFRNPWTKDIEFLVAKNAYIASEVSDDASPSAAATAGFSANDIFYAGSGITSNNTPTRVRLFSMEVEASKIGQTVADEVLDSHRSRSSASGASSSAVRSPGSVLSGSTTASPFSNVGSPLSEGVPFINAVVAPTFTNEDLRRAALQGMGPSGNAMGPAISITRSATSSEHHSSGIALQQGSANSDSNGGIVGAVGLLRSPRANNHSTNNHVKMDHTNLLNEAGLQAAEDMMEVIGGLMMDQSGSSSRETNGSGDGNDEAAMAVVMSLLEADAGLGGPVDFSGLPWPLP